MTADDHHSSNGSPQPAIDWGVCLATHGGWLRQVILARTGEAQAVDEVWQQVALAALEQRSPLADPANVAPWLHRLAVILSARYCRQQGRSRKALSALSEHRMGAGATAGDALAWLLQKERHELTRRAMARMAPRDAEILMLKYGQRWSYQQISQHLGI